MNCSISLTELASANEVTRPIAGHDEIQMIKIAIGRPTPKAPPIMNKKSESQIVPSSRADMRSPIAITGMNKQPNQTKRTQMFEQANETGCPNL
jgi:hypothetical protein